LHELSRLGFTRAVLPRASLEGVKGPAGLETIGIGHVGALSEFFPPGRPGRRNPV
jgi:hypothetical protein